MALTPGLGRNPTGTAASTASGPFKTTGTAAQSGIDSMGNTGRAGGQWGNSGTGVTNGDDTNWYHGLTTYGTTQNWGGFAASQNQADYTSADSFSHSSDFDKSGGLAYLDSTGSAAVDKNGTVYIKVTSNTGDVGWMPYQNGKNYAGGVTNGDSYHIGTSNGYEVADSIAHSGVKNQTHDQWVADKQGTINAASGAYNTVSKFKAPTAPPDSSTVPVPTPTQVEQGTAPVTPPAVNPANHDFIAGLQQSIQTGNGAAVQQSQAQGITNSNQLRLAAGADTLHGNYAAAGAAGQAQSALSGNDQVLAGNTAQAKQTQQNESLLGQALTQESSQALSGDEAAVDQQITNISDVMDSIRNAIKGATDAQSLQIQDILNDLTNKINDYKNAQGNKTMGDQQKMQVIQTILAGAGSLGALIAKGVSAGGS